MRLTKHFELWEFEKSQTAIRKGINNSIPVELIPNVTKLAEMLEKIREILKAPIIISSGYRCPELNWLIGGSTKSQHMTASAADFNVPGYTVKEVCEIISESKIPYDQLINELNSWIHISYSATPRKQYFDIM